MLNSGNGQCKGSKKSVRAIKTSINDTTTLTTQIIKMTFPLDKFCDKFKVQTMSKLAMKGVQNENTYRYLVSTIMPVSLQTGALSVMICTQESTPTSSMVLMNNSPIKCANNSRMCK